MNFHAEKKGHYFDSSKIIFDLETSVEIGHQPITTSKTTTIDTSMIRLQSLV
jgi:hypothetical protein